MTSRVLVTGISGHVGQHVGAELLRHGYEVVGTVRSESKAAATKAAIGAVVPTDRLRFAEADLLSDSGWDEAMHGCSYVIHVASPFVLAEPKDEDDLIIPAVQGNATRGPCRAAGERDSAGPHLLDRCDDGREAERSLRTGRMVRHHPQHRCLREEQDVG
jgi:uncharacterized protein YbjT (DUF2867 family)